jgi:hypothetical protein
VRFFILYVAKVYLKQYDVIILFATKVFHYFKNVKRNSSLLLVYAKLIDKKTNEENRLNKV